MSITVLLIAFLISIINVNNVNAICKHEGGEWCCYDFEMFQSCVDLQQTLENYAYIVMLSTGKFELNLHRPILNCGQYAQCCESDASGRCQTISVKNLCIKAQNAMTAFNTVVEIDFNLNITDEIKKGAPVFACNDIISAANKIDNFGGINGINGINVINVMIWFVILF